MAYRNEYEKLAFAINGYINDAKKLGLSINNPITLRALGSILQGRLDAEYYTIVVSYSMPAAVPECPIVWIDAANKKAYRQNQDSTWSECIECDDFSIHSTRLSNSGGSSGGGTGLDAATVQLMVTSSVSSAVTSISSRLGEGVQTLDDLRAVNVSYVADKEMKLVEDLHQIFAYNATGTGVDNNGTIIVPNSGVGVWNLVDATNVDGGTY